MNERKNRWKSKTFKVTVKLPEHVPESVRREKLNRLYDLLKPKIDDSSGADNDDKNSSEIA